MCAENCVNMSIRKFGYKDAKSAILKQSPEYVDHFNRFGVIFHWGVYSIFAYNPPKTAKSKKMGICNGSEWYWLRYKRVFTYGPKTKDYHKTHFNDKDYYEFIDEFEKRAETVDFDNWVALLKSKGVSYVIITSKHHDGISLYPSKYGTYPTKRDYIGELASAVRKAGMKFGVYYSLMEITSQYGNGRSAKKVTSYVNDVMIPQLKELVDRYDVDMIWSDGDWNQTAINWKSYEFLDWLFTESKVKDKVVVNDRWGKEFTPKPIYRIRNNFSDRYMPENIKDGDVLNWEHINTISGSWGYACNQETNDYKTEIQLKQLYDKTLNLGGYFLLNFGPDSYGNLDEAEVKIFKKLDL